MDGAERFDLTGRVFGKLTALKCTQGSRSRGIWECRCECGSIRLVSYHNLVHGCTRSCGCARGLSNAKDLTGKRFGRLTAVERTGEKEGSNYIWRCRCDCGNEARVKSSSLLSGNTRSCGCLTDEAKRRALRDIAGERFGRLTAVSAVQKRSGGSVVWLCRCDCGTEREYPAKTLLEGKAVSCGCIKSENDALQRHLHYIDGTRVESLERMGKPRSDNTSGYPGLRYVRGKWEARIGFKKKVYYLGTYIDKDKALRVRKEAEQRLSDVFVDWYYMTFPDRPTKKRRQMNIGKETGGSDRD